MEIDEALSSVRATLINFEHVRKYNPIAYESMEEMDLSITALYNYVLRCEKEKKLNDALKGKTNVKDN